MNIHDKAVAEFEESVRQCWSEVPHFTKSTDECTMYEDAALNRAWWGFQAGIFYAEKNGATPHGSVAVPQTVLHQISNTLAGYLK